MAYYVCMTDRFMSGWGPAKDKDNVLVIECATYDEARNALRHALTRNEMCRQRINLKPPKQRSGVLYTNKQYADLGPIWKGE
jgi:hypothetical protein